VREPVAAPARELERVVYNRRVMLIDAAYLILDAFDVDTE
jgi:hypothetical protein